MGFFQHMQKGPFGVHQGAQADRACIAHNYYTESMNLFLPRVNETRDQTGIIGCELPIVNYTAAIIYKIFGFNDSYYRVMMWLLMAFGLYAVFSIFRLYGLSNALSLLFSYLWYCSPILMFYTPSYLPDTASLSINLIALYFLLKYIKTGHTKKGLIGFASFSCLAMLIKVTSVILPIAVLAIIAFSSVFKDKDLSIKLDNKRNWIIGILSAFGIAIIWYQYSAYLNVKHETSLFHLNGRWATSIDQFKEYWHAFSSNWLGLIYKKWMLVTILVIYIILLVKYYKRNLALALLSLLYVLGSISFFVLQQAQFRHHDYYLITLFPSLLLMLLFVVTTIKNLKWGFVSKGLLILLASVFLFISYSFGKQHLKSRYTPNDYWEQSFFYEEDFEEVEKIKKEHNITRAEKVFVAYDLNPNVVLYFCDLKGYKIAPDFSQEHLNYLYRLQKPRILIVNDSAYLDHHPKELNIHFKEIAKTKTMTFYELDYSDFEKTNKE